MSSLSFIRRHLATQFRGQDPVDVSQYRELEDAFTQDADLDATDSALVYHCALASTAPSDLVPDQSRRFKVHTIRVACSYSPDPSDSEVALELEQWASTALYNPLRRGDTGPFVDITGISVTPGARTNADDSGRTRVELEIQGIVEIPVGG